MATPTNYAVSIVYTISPSSPILDKDILNFTCSVAAADADPALGLAGALTAFRAAVTTAYSIRNTNVLDLTTIPGHATTQGTDTGTGPVS